MDKRQIEDRSGVDKVFNIKFEKMYLHPQYRLCHDNEHKIGATGLMKIFEIIPSRSVDPRFIGRWDSNKELLDIDIEGVDANTKNKFRGQKVGYDGHHPKLIRQNRTFLIRIEILSVLYFLGEVFFNVNRTAKFQSGTYSLTGFPVKLPYKRRG